MNKAISLVLKESSIFLLEDRKKKLVYITLPIKGGDAQALVDLLKTLDCVKSVGMVAERYLIK